MRRVFALALVMAMMAGCVQRPDDPLDPVEPPPAVEPDVTASGDLMAGVEAAKPDTAVDLNDGDTADGLAQFGVKLFQESLGGGNTLVSPLSVLQALAMTANGAAGDTLAQLEAAFGADMDTLNAWMYACAQALPQEEGAAVHIANGIWLNAAGGLTVEPDFLQTNGSYYGAGVYERAFSPALADEINAWVAEHTAGRIDGIVDEVPAEAVSYLVNALSFDGVWEDIYREDQVQSDTFTAADGSEQDAQFMYSTELGFLQDEHAKGFIKYYQGRTLAFAALLPEEGMTVADYAAHLTGAHLREMLAEAQNDVFVNTAIPKFSMEYGAELSETLAALGVTDAFDPDRADFSRLGTCQGNELYISRVMHKTFINVDERGTQAGAATAVEVEAASALGPEERVYLDRPFLYMLIDCQTNMPLFIGTVESL